MEQLTCLKTLIEAEAVAADLYNQQLYYIERLQKTLAQITNSYDIYEYHCKLNTANELKYCLLKNYERAHEELKEATTC